MLLLQPFAAWAAPSAEQARALVERVVALSLVPGPGAKMPAEWPALAPHRSAFDSEFFSLLEWVSTPQPDVEGRQWHIDFNPIWHVQSSGVTGISIGTPKREGEFQAVVVDYRSPSIRESQPPTKFHTVWLVGEANGKAVLKDIRYTAKFAQATQTGTSLAAMRKARNGFRAP